MLYHPHLWQIKKGNIENDIFFLFVKKKKKYNCQIFSDGQHEDRCKIDKHLSIFFHSYCYLEKEN